MSYSKSKLLPQPNQVQSNQLQPKQPFPLLPSGPLCDHDNLCVLNTLTSGNIKTNSISANNIKVPWKSAGEQVDLTEMLKKSLVSIEDIKNSIGNLNNRVVNQNRQIETMNIEQIKQQVAQLYQKIVEIESINNRVSNIETRIDNRAEELNRSITNINNWLTRHEQTLSNIEGSLSNINQRLSRTVDYDTFSEQLSSTNSQLGILSSELNRTYLMQQQINANYHQRLNNLEARR
jgi:chromosome segregation ATPase